MRRGAPLASCAGARKRAASARRGERAERASARGARADHQVLLVVRVVLVRVRVAALDARKFFFLEYKGCIHEFKISGLEYVFS